MLSGVFRTKERKITAGLLGFIIIIIGILLLFDYSNNKRYTMAAVMAENYLKAGNYQQAAESYTKAMSMKKMDKQLLSIGLAKAYVGMNDYDSALEVLRSCYQKTHGIKIREMIEKVTSQKTDYEYLQTSSRAEVYFTNKEYDKAIAEYEKAKQIKSKVVTSYQRIAQAYIEKKDYDQAREEVLEGMELTKDDSLTKLLRVTEEYLIKEQYEKLINQASEFIYQENYEEGIAEYEKAIMLRPKESTAYIGLTQVYLTQTQYSDAVLLLQEAVKVTQDKELKDLLKKAARLKKAQEERDALLCKLFNALGKRNYKAAAVLTEKAYNNNLIVKNLPVYYGEDDPDSTEEQIMILSGEGNVYLGGVGNGARNGNGIFFLVESGGQNPDYYSYDGDWKEDKPNGTGRTEEVQHLTGADGAAYISKTVTEGSYSKAYENGSMMKYFYRDSVETGRVKYIAKNGVAMPLADNGSAESPNTPERPYRIGAVYIGDQPSGNDYYVEPKAVWGVKTFINDLQ